jgi:hypothetical protein
MKIRMITNNRFFRFKFWRLIGVTLLIMAIAIIFNLFGIYLTGGLGNWIVWLADSYWYFFVWRMVLYVALVWGWVTLRRRILAREPDSRRRVFPVEIAVVGTFLLMEVIRSQPYWA